MTNKTEVVDLVGMPLKQGDFLAQAYNIGRCAGLKFSRIISVNVEKQSLRVIGCEKKGHSDEYTWRMNVKPYTINFPQRSIWIEGNSTPAVVNRLLTEEYNNIMEKGVNNGNL